MTLLALTQVKLVRFIIVSVLLPFYLTAVYVLRAFSWLGDKADDILWRIS